MENLIPALRESIFKDSLADGVASIAEVGIDSIMSEAKNEPFSTGMR